MARSKIILKWKEPRELSKFYKHHLSLTQRLWFTYRISFLAGAFLGLVIVLTAGLPSSSEEVRRLLIATPIACFGMGLLFVILHRLLSLFSPQIYFTEHFVARQLADNIQRWHYSDIQNYSFEYVPIGKQTIRLLKINPIEGEVVSFEIAKRISEDQIENALAGKVTASPSVTGS